jgi:DNA-binding winged helix-turn-helix (wHTH) protein/predicted ATPase
MAAGASKETTVEREASQADRAAAITFAPFRLDLRAGQLFRGSEPVPLRPKTWSVLRYLTERAGVLVTKNDLLDALWPNIAVTESVMSKSIGELRVALGDSSRAPRFIETVQRRGFRFIAKVNDEWRAMSDEQKDSTANQLVTHHSSLVTPFVGRTKEMQQLAARFAKACAGERQIVFVTGPAGIGKTALVEAFLTQLSAVSSTNNLTPNNLTPCPIARGGCVEQYGPREAYMPVLEALDRLARGPDADRLAVLLRRVAPTWLAQMPWLIGDDEQALRQSLQAVRAERMLREFAAFIEALATDVTVVLVLEDLHWSDASTVDLLAHLGERHEAARLLLIGTHRPAEVIVGDHPFGRAKRALQVHGRCTELSLNDLTEEGVRSYLQARFPGSDFPPALARRMHTHTGGNPLFLVAAVDQLLSHGYVLDTAPGWALTTPPGQIDLGVPEDARVMIHNQLDGLSPADRELLEAASVAGNEFDAPVVAAALACEPADAEMRCETLVRAQRFLRVAGQVEWPHRSVTRRYAFTHDLYRQVVYAAIPEGQCMRLHQRIGEALEAASGARQMDIAAQLAIHFTRGRDDARALRYLEAAASRARQRFASREAIGYLDAALGMVALLPDNDERRRRELELRLLLGAALGDIHGFASERVRDNYERAFELCAAVGSAAQLFGVLYARWYFHAIRADRDEAIALAAELDDLARRLRSAEHRVVADTVLLRTALYDGRFAEVNPPMQRLRGPQSRRKHVAAAAYGPDPLVVAMSHCAIALWFLGYPERAERMARSALARARESGHFLTLCAVLVQTAMVELLCRHAAEGDDLAKQAVSVSAEHGFAFWNAVACLLTGWAAVQQDQASEGSAVIERALAAMQATGTRFFSAFGYAFLAEGRLRAGAPADGLAAADAGLAVAHATLDRAYEPELWRLKGELFLAQSKVQGPKSNVKAGDTRADTVVQGEACFQRALVLAGASQAKSLELRAATSLARAWQGRGCGTDARKLLGGICKWFGTRAGTADLVEARAQLAELAGVR